MGWGSADCGHRYRDKGRAFVKTVLNLRFQEGNISTNRAKQLVHHEQSIPCQRIEMLILKFDRCPQYGVQRSTAQKPDKNSLVR
jgi:hypothetical protein